MWGFQAIREGNLVACMGRKLAGYTCCLLRRVGPWTLAFEGAGSVIVVWLLYTAYVEVKMADMVGMLA